MLEEAGYDGFVAERPGLPLRSFSLAGLGTQSERRFYASALQAIIESLLAEMNRRGYYAVFIQRDRIVDSRLSVVIDQCEQLGLRRRGGELVVANVDPGLARRLGLGVRADAGDHGEAERRRAVVDDSFLSDPGRSATQDRGRLHAHQIDADGEKGFC